MLSVIFKKQNSQKKNPGETLIEEKNSIGYAVLMTQPQTARAHLGSKRVDHQNDDYNDHEFSRPYADLLGIKDDLPTAQNCIAEYGSPAI